jgi:precorrin-4 C11-methyltransferase
MSIFSNNADTSALPPAAMVHFIGAGPGDPELITLKARRLIADAAVVIYAGSLVNPQVLAHARAGAEIYDSATMKLAEQIEVMAATVAQGRSVARLHTGDPALYGAILEQMRSLDRVDIPYDIVPGVSSAFAAAAALGIEYTVPGDTQTVILTRMAGKTAVPERERLRDLAAHRTSLVLFLSAGMIGQVVDELRAAGYSADTPIAVVARASWPDELVVRGTLADIARRSEAAEITHQALIIVSPALQLQAGGATAHDSFLYGAAQQELVRGSSIAIVALTRGGSETGSRLHRLLPGSVLCLPERFLATAQPGDGQVLPYTTSVRQALQEAFGTHNALIAIMSTGIVVRDLAPLLRSKHADPAVVVVDERGQHAISLLAGHKGGGNELARRVAALLGATPVITTASDLNELPALDLIGQPGGWRLAEAGAMTLVSATLVNGEALGAVQDAGDETWWPDPLPANLSRYPSLEALAVAAQQTGLSCGLLITHRAPAHGVTSAVPNLVVYHPPCLVLGIGCNRGTPGSEILDAVDATLATAGLAPESVYLVATVENKAGELGLLEACRERGWSLHAFSRSELAAAGDPPNPSPYAQAALGVPGVAEPAALLAACGPPGTAIDLTDLLVEKQKFPNVTVAVARAPVENWQPLAGREVDRQVELRVFHAHERGGHA